MIPKNYKGKAIRTYTYPKSFNGKKWTDETEEFEVVVMAIADGYAMARRPRCMPFVCSVKELRELT